MPDPITDWLVWDVLKVVQAQSHDRSTSDLTVAVDGTEFHCHRDVLAPACHHLLRRTRQCAADGLALSPHGLVRIDLPEIRIPPGLRTRSEYDPAAWFGLFLEMVYDQIRIYSREELLGIVQVADFIRCPDITALCDRLLCKKGFDVETVLDVKQFCRYYALPLTLHAVKRYVGRRLRQLYSNPQLYEMGIEDFVDTVRAAPECDQWQFLVTLCYAARHIPKRNLIPNEVRIADAKMSAIFQKLVLEFSDHWDRTTAETIYRHIHYRDICIGPGHGHQRFLQDLVVYVIYRFDKRNANSQPSKHD